MTKKIVAGAVAVAAAVVTDRVLGFFDIKYIFVTITAMAVGLGVYYMLWTMMRQK